MLSKLSLPTEINFLIIKFCSFNNLSKLLKLFNLKIYHDEIKKKIINFYEHEEREYWFKLYCSALKKTHDSDTENYEYELYIDYGPVRSNNNNINIRNDNKQLKDSISDNKQLKDSINENNNIDKILTKNKVFTMNLKEYYKTWDVVCTNRKTFFTRNYFVTD